MDISALPKAEIHCHIDGIVNPDMLQKLEKDGVPLPLTPDDLLAAYPVSSFDEFIHWFEIKKPLDGNLEIFKHILAQHIDRLKAQNVTFTEIMLGSSELPHDEGQLVEKFSEFRESVDKLEDGKIQIEFLIKLSLMLLS